MKGSPLLEASRSSATQKISYTLWDLKADWHVRKSPAHAQNNFLLTIIVIIFLNVPSPDIKKNSMIFSH
jgi:hypothetical protein